jgi:hypothetical protein
MWVSFLVVGVDWGRMFFWGIVFFGGFSDYLFKARDDIFNVD